MSQFLTDHNEIMDWTRQHGDCSAGSWSCLAGVVNFQCDVTFKNLQLPDGMLPIKISAAQTLTFKNSNIRNLSGLSAFGTFGELILMECNDLLDLTGIPFVNELNILECGRIASLNGLDQEYISELVLSECPLLTDLTAMPRVITSYLSLHRMSLSSVDVLPQVIGHQLRITLCEHLKTLQGIEKIKIGSSINAGRFIFSNNVESHILGLLLMPDLHFVDSWNLPVASIITKHLQGDRDIFACQQELIDAGFPDYAQL